MTKQKDTAPNVADNAPEGMALSDSEQVAARKDGAKDAVKDAAKDTYTYLTDGNLPGDAPANPYPGHDEIQLFAHNLDLGVEPFEKLIADKDSGLPEEKIYGLLALERNGQNRTPYVKAMMTRLKLKADELPGGGPSYTNDVTNITDL